MSDERALIDVLAEAATTMPWPSAEIDVRLLDWSRRAVAGEISIEVVPAPRPDVTVVFADGRYLVARRSLASPAFTELDRRTLVALTAMATTSRHAAKREARLRRQALTDDLTGLWHHGFFRELFETLSETRAGETIGVLFLDIDRFKQLNEELGHLDADDVLREVAHRLRTGLPDGSIVGRMGGDEFAAVVRHLDGADHLAQMVDAIQAAIAAPVAVQDLLLSIDVTIGSALSVSGADDPDLLLREAEAEMRRRKRSRGPDATPPRWYDERTVLRDMIDHGEVEVAYQPIVDMASGVVHGYEALVRGRHLEFGQVSPLMLVGSASKLRMLDELTEVVVEQAIDTISRVSGLAGRRVALSVNIEFEQLRRDSRLLESLPGRLADTGVDLVLELSERHVGRWTPSQKMAATELAGAGVGLAVDDFGAGYSTFALLNSWAWTWVKIDQTLVATDGGDQSRKLLGHVARMLRDLDLVAVAEGVETPDQLRHAREIGIALAQGAHLTAPTSADAVLGAVTAHGLTLPHLGPQLGS